ncbi:MAG: glycogen debranching protein GlgX [Spirochaetales bacterium]|nr:glycogen debranching protein GlgX [Spirochaetales bacterium]
MGAIALLDGFNFAVFSKSAKKVTLVIFAPGREEPQIEIILNPAANRTGNIWHVKIKGLPRNFRYGYRVDGPWNPEKGLYFKHENILLDPYARAITGGEVWGEPKKRISSSNGTTNYLRRCFLPESDFDWGDDKPINRPLKETIIYELHVRGFTIHGNANVRYPGTFRGLVEKIPYLRELGVNAVELMPINEFDENDIPFIDPYTGEKLKNFWGYNSIAFFAPKASYAESGVRNKQVEEFKEMIREFHRNDIEVILDVVFNHTAESGKDGKIYSFRGFEGQVYYILNKEGEDMNYSGCGNTVNCNHPLVRSLIIDCLRYWVSEMHVDGFRFDLASVLGRDQDGKVMKNPPVLDEIANDPVLAHTKIIAEAWDAAGLYQVGSFPAWGRWAEWNGKFRDDVRRYLRGDHNTIGTLATRLAGSSDLYHSSGRHPYHSINFITSHDGFTLYDLFSYNRKHNLANGELDKDGDNGNFSFNCGEEGPSDDPAVLNLRMRHIRNAFALLMLSQGTPMMLAGDEFCRTQKGNNNCYSQDNGLSWVDWRLLDKHADFFRFCRLMIRFRKAHPVLRRDYFFTGHTAEGDYFPDISWLGEKAERPDFSSDSLCLGALISGYRGAGKDHDNDIYIASNMFDRDIRMEIPALPAGMCWYLKINTACQPPNDILEDGEEKPVTKKWLLIGSHSIIVLISKTC